MAAHRHTARSLAVPCAAAAVLLAACAGSSGPPAAPDPETDPERVPVGYGTLPRDQVTGAVTTVHADDLERSGVGRVEQLILGRVPGVTVLRRSNGGYSVRVRGAGGFVSDGEPLFVIDGTPVRALGPAGALDGLSPSDVARIDVLKDAASTAIYGVQGGNGVILITTRRHQ